MKRVVILGATGSIGIQTVDVLHRLGGFKVVGLCAKSSWRRICELAMELGAEAISLVERGPAELAKAHLPETVKVFSGKGSAEALIAETKPDIVVSAISGFAGVAPTVFALEKTEARVLLATKETAVTMGYLVRKYFEGGRIVPVDSEHCALFQLLRSCQREHLRRAYITASGGPFWGKDVDFSSVSPEDALKHPVWKMGARITIDSATMFNKGLEVIEAHWLFGLDYEKIGVLVHPEGIVHALIELVSGHVNMWAFPHDMRFPIALALTFPEHVDIGLKPFQLAGRKLSFFEPDLNRFKALRVALQAAKEGPVATISANAADEEAVSFFLSGAIKFSQIPDIIEMAVEWATGRFSLGEDYMLDEAEAIDVATREFVRREAKR